MVLTLFIGTAAYAGGGTRSSQDPFPPERDMRPFKTDGCTLAPDGTINRPRLFRECCVAHDLRYWGGGRKEDRKFADKELKQCIEDLAGPGYGRIYYTGVNLGRLSPFSIASKRWGNAWFELDGNRDLLTEEIDRLIEEVRLLDLPMELRDLYISELEARLSE